MSFLLLTPYFCLPLLAFTSFFALGAPFLVELIIGYVYLEPFLLRLLIKIVSSSDNDVSFISIDTFLLPS